MHPGNDKRPAAIPGQITEKEETIAVTSVNAGSRSRHCLLSRRIRAFFSTAPF